MLEPRLMPIGDHLRWLARACKRARAKSGGLKRYPRAKSAPLDGQMRRRRARAAALGRARAGGWLRGAAARSVCAGSSQRPETIRPRRSSRTLVLLTARRRRTAARTRPPRPPLTSATGRLAVTNGLGRSSVVERTSMRERETAAAKLTTKTNAVLLALMLAPLAAALQPTLPTSTRARGRRRRSRWSTARRARRAGSSCRRSRRAS